MTTIAKIKHLIGLLLPSMLAKGIEMTITEKEFNLMLKQALGDNALTLKIVEVPYQHKSVSFVYNKIRYICRGVINSKNELDTKSIKYSKNKFLTVVEMTPRQTEPIMPDFPMERKRHNPATYDFDINAFDFDMSSDERVKKDILIHYKTISNLDELTFSLLKIG